MGLLTTADTTFSNMTFSTGSYINCFGKDVVIKKNGTDDYIIKYTYAVYPSEAKESIVYTEKCILSTSSVLDLFSQIYDDLTDTFPSANNV